MSSVSNSSSGRINSPNLNNIQPIPKIDETIDYLKQNGFADIDHETVKIAVNIVSNFQKTFSEEPFDSDNKEHIEKMSRLFSAPQESEVSSSSRSSLEQSSFRDVYEDVIDLVPEKVFGIAKVIVRSLVAMDNGIIKSLKGQGWIRESPSLAKEYTPIMDWLDEKDGSKARSDIENFTRKVFPEFRETVRGIKEQQETITGDLRDVKQSLDEGLSQVEAALKLGDPVAIKSSIDSLNKTVSSLSEEQQAAFNKVHQQFAEEAEKKEKEKETQKKWGYAVRGAAALERGFQAVGSYIASGHYREDQSRESERVLRKRQQRLRELLNDPKNPVPDSINMGDFLKKELENSKETLEEFRGLINLLRIDLAFGESIKGNQKVVGQGIDNRFAAHVKSLKKIEDAKNKFCRSYEKLGLGASLVSSVASIAGPPGQIASSLLNSINTVTQARASCKARFFDGERRWELGGIEREEKGAYRLKESRQRNQDLDQVSKSQIEAIESRERDILASNPQFYSEYVVNQQRTLQKKLSRRKELKTELRETLKEIRVPFRVIAFEELMKMNPTLAKKYSRATNRRFMLDTSRGIIAISDSPPDGYGRGKKKTYSVYNINTDSNEAIATVQNQNVNTYVANQPILDKYLDKTIQDAFKGKFQDQTSVDCQIKIRGICKELRDLEGYKDDEEGGFYSGDIKRQKTQIVEIVTGFASGKLNEAKGHAQAAKELASQGNVREAIASTKEAHKSAIEAQEYALKMQVQEIRRLEQVIEIGKKNVAEEGSPKARQALVEAERAKAELIEALNKRYKSLSGIDPEKFKIETNPLEFFAEFGPEFDNLSSEEIRKAVSTVIETADKSATVAKDTKDTVTSAEIRRVELAPLIDLSKSRQEKFGLLSRVINPSEDPVFAYAENLLKENQEQNDAVLSILQNSINHSIKLIKVLDTVRGKKEGEGLANKIPEKAPEVIMKSAELVTCVEQCYLAVKVFIGIVNGKKAGSAVGDILQTPDSKENKEGPKANDNGAGKTGQQISGALEVIKNLSADKKIKSLLSVAIPMSQAVILCHELYLISEGKGDPEDPQLAAIKKLHEDMKKGFEEIKKGIENLQASVKEGLVLVHHHINLAHQSLSLQGETNTTLILDTVFYGRADDCFASIRRNLMRQYFESSSESVYSRYIINDLRHSGVESPEVRKKRQETERNLLRDLLHTFQRILGDLGTPDQNGLWLKRQSRGESVRGPIELAVAQKNPVHTTGLLASHLLEVERVPDFYQYEHYAHIFIQLAAKLLVDDVKDRFTEIQDISSALIAQGNSLDTLLSQATLEKALKEYQEKQVELVEYLQKGMKKYQYQDKSGKYQITVKSAKADTFSFLEGFAPGFYRNFTVEEATRNSQKQTNIETPTTDSVTKFNGRRYFELYEQIRGGAFASFKRDILNHFARSSIKRTLVSVNETLFFQRQISLKELSKNLVSKDLKRKNLLEKTLLSIWENKQFQRITPADRKEIRGNFIELAYRVDSETKQMLRQINFCLFESREEMVCRIRKMNPEWIPVDRRQQFRGRTKNSDRESKEKEIDLDHPIPPKRVLKQGFNPMINGGDSEYYEEVLDEREELRRLINNIDSTINKLHSHAAFHLEKKKGHPLVSYICQ